MNPLYLIGIAGVGLWAWNRSRRRKAAARAAATAPPPNGGGGAPLPGLLDCLDPGFHFIEAGEPVRLCVGTAVLFAPADDIQALAPAPAGTFTKTDDVFTFSENGLYMVANADQSQAGWVFQLGVIPAKGGCIDGGMPAAPTAVMAAPFNEIDLCDATPEKVPEIVPDDEANQGAWVRDGTKIYFTKEGHYRISGPNNVEPAWSITVKKA